jgi:hypothetical protein
LGAGLVLMLGEGLALGLEVAWVCTSATARALGLALAWAAALGAVLVVALEVGWGSR